MELTDRDNGAPPSAPQTSSTSTQHREPAYGPQVTLPFTGLGGPEGVAVDTAGNVYVTDRGQQSGAETGGRARPPRRVLPFTGLNGPDGVAVDTAGNVYVADWRTIGC